MLDTDVLHSSWHISDQYTVFLIHKTVPYSLYFTRGGHMLPDNFQTNIIISVNLSDGWVVPTSL